MTDIFQGEGFPIGILVGMLWVMFLNWNNKEIKKLGKRLSKEEKSHE